MLCVRSLANGRPPAGRALPVVVAIPRCAASAVEGPQFQHMHRTQVHAKQKGHMQGQTSFFSTAVNSISCDVYINKGKGASPPPPPTQDAIFMHGILGSKRNWRTPAKLLTQISPELRVLALDHRGHGRSHGLSGENTLLAAAADVRSIVHSESITPQKLQLLVGHSFGGKVALIYLQQLYNDSTAGGAVLPRDTWILDCLPGVFDGTSAISEGNDDGYGDPDAPDEERRATGAVNRESVGGIFHILSTLPEYFGDPKEIQRTLIEMGVTLPVAQWLTSECRTNPNSDTVTRNNPSAAGNYQLGFDLHVATELFADFCITDLWGFLEAFDGRGRAYGGEDARIHFVRAGKNPLWKLGTTLSRFERLMGDHPDGAGAGAGMGKGSVRLHTMPAVGHWLHVEDARGLMHLIKTESGSGRGQGQGQGQVNKI